MWSKPISTLTSNFQVLHGHFMFATSASSNSLTQAFCGPEISSCRRLGFSDQGYYPEISWPFRNQSFANVRPRFEQSLEPFLKGKKSGWKFPIIAQSKLVNWTKFICYYRARYMKLFKWFFVWSFLWVYFTSFHEYHGTKSQCHLPLDSSKFSADICLLLYTNPQSGAYQVTGE